jgi:pimeloyl-ACP methyl ester carboxylesterase
MEVPVLLMTGDTDLFAPPAMQRLFAQKFPNSETHVVREAGHATYWEQPDEFNEVVLGWVDSHSPEAE